MGPACWYFGLAKQEDVTAKKNNAKATIPRDITQKDTTTGGNETLRDALMLAKCD
jgi:hypothetical protein